MSADFVSGWFGEGEAAWHGEGTVEDGLATPAEVIEKGGLDWPVVTTPLYADPHDTDADDADLVAVDSHVLVRRGDTGKQFAIMGRDFTPVQNLRLAELVCEVTGHTDAIITAGVALAGGARVAITAKLTEDMFIAGEQFERYLVGANGHDGSLALSIYPTDVRVVCRNTLGWSLANAIAGGRIFRARHTPSITDRGPEAIEAIRRAIGWFDTLRVVGEQLAATPITKADATAFFANLVPFVDVPTGDGAAVDNARKRQLTANALRDLVANVWSTTPDLENIRMTKWGLAQAVAEAEKQIKPRQSDEARWERVILAPELTPRAYSLLAA